MAIRTLEAEPQTQESKTTPETVFGEKSVLTRKMIYPDTPHKPKPYCSVVIGQDGQIIYKQRNIKGEILEEYS